MRKSKSVWLGFIAVLAGIGTVLGLEIGQADQERLAETAVASTATGGISSAVYGVTKRKSDWGLTEKYSGKLREDP